MFSYVDVPYKSIIFSHTPPSFLKHDGCSKLAFVNTKQSLVRSVVRRLLYPQRTLEGYEVRQRMPANNETKSQTIRGSSKVCT